VVFFAEGIPIIFRVTGKNIFEILAVIGITQFEK